MNQRRNRMGQRPVSFAGTRIIRVLLFQRFNLLAARET